MNKKTKKIKIDLGCRNEKIDENWIGVDIDRTCNPEIVHDLTKTPWPFPDNYADEIRSSHVVEHLPDLNSFLDEVTRVAKNDSSFELIFPHYSRSMHSSQHIRHYGIRILNDFPQFRIESIRLKYISWRWKIGLRHLYKFPFYLFVSIIEFFANLSPRFFERFWCFWFGGFDHVIIKSKIIKK